MMGEAFCRFPAVVISTQASSYALPITLIASSAHLAKAAIMSIGRAPASAVNKRFA
jgi:hypothetical protein